LADGAYDVIVLGTGLKECILSGFASMNKLKVLHIDRNKYYGGESASLNIDQLYERFDKKKPEKNDYGKAQQWNVDLCPKFLMAFGNLVKILVYTKVTKYLDFRSVAGSYVYSNSKVHKVPVTATEAGTSSLLGFFEKFRFKNFLGYVNAWLPEDQKTHEKRDLNKMTMKALYAEYSLEESAQLFTGHAVALCINDDYMEIPARSTVEKLQLYANSLARYGNSPYIYPEYGLGGIAESFTRFAAVNGGTFMLNHAIAEILYDKDGKVTGVKDSEGKTATCKKLICDPTYLLKSGKVKQVGQVARCICILSHEIANTNKADSIQLIIPAKSLKGRKSDIYISAVSDLHKVCGKGKFIAVISANVETKDPEKELEIALGLLGKIDEKFFWVQDRYEPTNDSSKDNVFINSSFTATSHWEDATDEVLSMYSKLFGKSLDMSNMKTLDQQNEEDEKQ